MAMTMLPNAATAQIPQLNGMVVSSNNETRTGLWSLPKEQGGEWTMKFAIEQGYATIYNGILNPDDNIYYETRCNAKYGSPIIYLDAYSLETGQKLWTNYPNLTFLPYDLTYNPYDARIYGLFSNSTNTGMVLATVSYANQANELTPICNLEGIWVAIAAAADGQLYGIQSEIDGMNGLLPNVVSSSLYKIDRLTGTTTLVGETGQKPLLTGSATIDPRSGRMFWTVGPDGQSSYLCEVDLTTGAATKIMDLDYNRQVSGLYVETPKAEDKAPAKVQNAVATFNGGSLSGTISFTAPSTLFDGTAASGSLAYSIITNGEVIASGTTTHGAANQVDVTVPERGKYTFVITVSNSVGSSPKENIEKFVGFGTPATPANVTAANTGSAIAVTWDAVTESTDGGYLDPSQVKYNVTRLPDNTVVAENITANSAQVNVDNDAPITSYTFTVTALNNGVPSESGISNPVVSGFAVLPWSEGFDSEDVTGFFTVLDGNDDGKKWSYYNGLMRMGYNTQMAMDDWLITPPMRVQANYSYRVTLKARSANTRYPERIEVKWGNSNTAAAMTHELIPSTDLTEDGFYTLEGVITPAENGTAYIGIHGISDADTYYLEIDDITVEAGLNTRAPAAPGSMTVTPDANGARKAVISLTAPVKNIDGNDITTLSKVVIKRGQTVVKEFQNPAPGASLTTEDVLDRAGDVTYSAYAVNSYGEGQAATVTVFIGTPLAKAPASVEFAEPTDGEVSLTWPPVTQAENGQSISSANVRYNVYDVTGSSPVLIEGGIEGTSHTFRAVAEGDQKFVQYSVSAVTDGGESQSTSTGIFPAGTPYTDFSESFAGGENSTIIRTERLNYGTWAPTADDSEVTSQDGDGGFMAMTAYFGGYNGAFSTGKISLDGISAPALNFYSYTPDNLNADSNPIEVFISADGGDWESVFRKTVIEIGAEKGWHEVEIPLNKYAGKDICIKFFAETSERPYTSTYIDNIRVFGQSPVELEVNDVNAPAYVRTGDSFGMDVTLRNNGTGTASGYDVQIFAGDRLCAEATPADIASGDSRTVHFDLVMSALADAETIAYKAVVNHADDPRDNNNSLETAITPVLSAQPAPESLTGTVADNMALLSWAAPALAESAPTVSDGFENAQAWSQSAPGWIFIDRDKAPICSFGNAEIPGVTAGTTTASFITFSTEDTFKDNPTLAARSGNRYIMAMARYDDATTDDWAISPELSCDAQTVSFYAKSYSSSYPERIEVYYSTGSFNPDDFVSAGLTVASVPAEWTKYEVALPAGARYFAIRSCATGAFMLMIDDVTYQAASSHNISLLGYNVYRDFTKVNDSPVAVTSYSDPIPDAGLHSWIVTAVYDRGESRGSNVLTELVTGIDDVHAGISVYTRPGRICIDGAQGMKVTVAATDGKLIHNAAAPASLTIDVMPGIYTVTVNGKTSKLLVR